MKAYLAIRKDGTPDVKEVTAIKSSSPTFIQKVFRNCVKEMADVRNYTEYKAAKERVQQVVRDAVRDLEAGKIPLKDLLYIRLRSTRTPLEKMKDKVLHQPHQSAVQLIGTGKTIHEGDAVRFIMVKLFQYQGRTVSGQLPIRL